MLLCVCFLCVVCFVFPSRFRDIFSCMRIVCELERPSELSWRARHGRTKKNPLEKDKECGSDQPHHI